MPTSFFYPPFIALAVWFILPKKLDIVAKYFIIVAVAMIIGVGLAIVSYIQLLQGVEYGLDLYLPTVLEKTIFYIIEPLLPMFFIHFFFLWRILRKYIKGKMPNSSSPKVAKA